MTCIPATALVGVWGPNREERLVPAHELRSGMNAFNPLNPDLRSTIENVIGYDNPTGACSLYRIGAFSGQAMQRVRWGGGWHEMHELCDSTVHICMYFISITLKDASTLWVDGVTVAAHNAARPSNNRYSTVRIKQGIRRCSVGD